MRKTRPKHKRAKITDKDLYEYLSKMSGFKVADITHVLSLYQELIKDSIIMGIEVPLPGVGYFTFKSFAEKCWGNYIRSDGKGVVSIGWTPAYRKTAFRFNKLFIGLIKTATAEPMSPEAEEEMRAEGKDPEEVKKNGTEKRYRRV